MAVLMILDSSDYPFEAYERVNEIMGIHGDADAPEGLIDHVAAEDERGFVVCDVWESAEAMGRFVQERLRPASEQAGLPEIQPRLLPVHNRLTGIASEPAVLVLIEIPEATPEGYDEMTKHMDAHVLDPHPAVSHTAARGESGGLVVADIWDSADKFAQFAQEQAAPAGAQIGVTGFQPRILTVKNRIRGKAAQPA